MIIELTTIIFHYAYQACFNKHVKKTEIKVESNKCTKKANNELELI